MLEPEKPEKPEKPGTGNTSSHHDQKPVFDQDEQQPVNPKDKPKE